MFILTLIEKKIGGAWNVPVSQTPSVKTASIGSNITPILKYLVFPFIDEEDEFNVSVVGSENGHTSATSRRRHHHKIAMAYNA